MNHVYRLNMNGYPMVLPQVGIGSFIDAVDLDKLSIIFFFQFLDRSIQEMSMNTCWSLVNVYKRSVLLGVLKESPYELNAGLESICWHNWHICHMI